MNKYIVIIVIIAVVILGGYFFLTGIYQPVVPISQSLNEQTNPQPTIETQVEQAPVEVKENIITYTNTGYFPNTITIKTGETIIFKNQSSKSMWPASAMHPTHTVYSGTSLDQHCPDTTNSSFDACTGILPSGSWSFKFDKIGSWGYHDHLSPKNFGKIIVE